MKGPQKQAAERWGRRAETLTTWLLRLKGYVILERCLVTPAGEIDIVARRGLVLVIVEVKARQLLGMEGILSDRQRRRLVHVATWLVGNQAGFENYAVRFDLVIVQPWQLPRHIEDAWRADNQTILIRI